MIRITEREDSIPNNIKIKKILNKYPLDKKTSQTFFSTRNNSNVNIKAINENPTKSKSL